MIRQLYTNGLTFFVRYILLNTMDDDIYVAKRCVCACVFRNQIEHISVIRKFFFQN